MAGVAGGRGDEFRLSCLPRVMVQFGAARLRASRGLIGGHCSVSAQEIREATKRFPRTQSRLATTLAPAHRLC
jgi:hypothetical protein